MRPPSAPPPPGPFLHGPPARRRSSWEAPARSARAGSSGRVPARVAWAGIQPADVAASLSTRPGLSISQVPEGRGVSGEVIGEPYLRGPGRVSSFGRERKAAAWCSSSSRAVAKNTRSGFMSGWWGRRSGAGHELRTRRQLIALRSSSTSSNQTS
jgi:hypothetical protein